MSFLRDGRFVGTSSITSGTVSFRNGQIEAGDQLLTLDGNVVGVGGLNSTKVDEFIRQSDRLSVQISLAKSGRTATTSTLFGGNYHYQLADNLGKNSTTTLNTEGENMVVSNLHIISLSSSSSSSIIII